MYKKTKENIEQEHHQSGFSLIEAVVSIGIFSILLFAVIGIYATMTNGVKAYREKTTIAALADQYMEIARNLPYSQVGTLSGNPHGTLPDQTSPVSTTINGNTYRIYYEITYIDDPADGTIVLGTDPMPDDYKQIKLTVANTTTNVSNNFVTTIVPKGLEGVINGGALSIKVFNAVGQPVSDANIQIINTGLSINLTRKSDGNGNWIEVGLPNSSNSYHVIVTKNGYSSDQTYPITGQNPNPTKADATITNGQVTQISFAIDLLSNLTLNTYNQTCAPLSNIGLNLTGAKLIGTSPNVYKFNNSYTSNGNGQIVLNNIEWDTYTPNITSPAYIIYGSSPIQQVSILPNTSQTFTLILGPSTPNSLLVIVKDSTTGNPIEGADVDLQTITPLTDTHKFTGGSIWGQQDWSGGFGQTDFSNPAQYFQDDGNINSSVAGQVTLLKSAGNYTSDGTLTSSSFNSGTTSTSYTTLSWQPTSQDPSTTLKFQLASNNDDTTWNYIGPDGTSGTYYTVPGTTINSNNNGNKYIRYEAYLSTTNISKTPTLTSVSLNYVSGCFTPGQVIFPGLAAGSNYNVIVSLSGYQTQSISNINISGYNVLQVLLGP